LHGTSYAKRRDAYEGGISYVSADIFSKPCYEMHTLFNRLSAAITEKLAACSDNYFYPTKAEVEWQARDSFG